MTFCVIWHMSQNAIKWQEPICGLISHTYWFQICIGCFGIVGNVLSIFVFMGKKFQKSFHILLTCLAMVDLVYIKMSILMFSVPQIAPYTSNMEQYLRMITLLLPLAHISLTGSIYFTLAITIERYLTVCHPFYKVSFRKKESSSRVTVNHLT